MFAHPIDGLAEREGESLGQLRKLRNRVSGGMDSRDGIPFNAAGHKPTHFLGSGWVFDQAKPVSWRQRSVYGRYSQMLQRARWSAMAHFSTSVQFDISMPRSAPVQADPHLYRLVDRIAMATQFNSRRRR